jgi:hypothetical protein
MFPEFLWHGRVVDDLDQMAAAPIVAAALRSHGVSTHHDLAIASAWGGR